MYSHLTFPEYVITIINNSVQDFKPLYMARFKKYDGFNTTFSDFECFLSFYTQMLLQAKEISSSNLKLKIEPDYPTLSKNFVSYNYYDNTHVHPIFRIEIQQIGNAITLCVPPF